MADQLPINGEVSTPPRLPLQMSSPNNKDLSSTEGDDVSSVSEYSVTMKNLLLDVCDSIDRETTEAPMDDVPLEENARYLAELKKQKMLEEKHVLLKEAYWKMIPRLFDHWDEDGCGTLDRDEILTGVREFCNTHGFEFYDGQAMELFAEVDHNGDGTLDRKEFTSFVDQFAISMGISVEQLARSAAKELYETQEKEDAPPELTEEELAHLKEKLKEEKRLHVEEAYWTLVPRLFDRWNTDGVGELSKDEILAGVKTFCENNDYDFDSERAVALFDEMDSDHSGELDRLEFSFFIDKFAKGCGIPWKEMALAVGEQLYDNQDGGEDSRKEYSEEERKRLEEAWTMMPRLFDIWDADESGELDKDEVLLGVQEFCDVRGFDFDSKRTLALFAEVDFNNDRALDRREFSIFIARFADIMGIPLDRMAFSVAEQLADVAMYGPGNQQQVLIQQPSDLDRFLPTMSSGTESKSPTKLNELKDVSTKLIMSDPNYESATSFASWRAEHDTELLEEFPSQRCSEATSTALPEQSPEGLVSLFGRNKNQKVKPGLKESFLGRSLRALASEEVS